LADPLFRTDPNYADPGTVVDPEPRTISNLIVDQTENNPAAVAAAAENPFSASIMSPGLDGILGTDDDRQVFFIPNTTPDVGLSAPFNAWMTFFGQFFDHGLDLVNKGKSGAVLIPLQPDDPLYVAGSIPGVRQIGHAIYRRIAANRIRQGKCTDEFCVP